MRKICLLLLCLLLAAVPVCAYDASAAQAAQIGVSRLTEAVPEDAADLLDGLSPEKTSDFGASAAGILRRALDACTSDLRQTAALSAKLVCTVLLCSVVSSFCAGTARRAVCFASAAAVTALCAGDFRSMVAVGADTVDGLTVFLACFLPVAAGAIALSGAEVSSAFFCAGAGVLSHKILTVLSGLMVPLLYAYLALATAEAASGEKSPGSLASAIPKFLKQAIRVTLFVFSAYLSVTRIVSGRADAVALKAAKLTVSTVVPMVGNLLADASESVLVSAALLQQSVGVFGLLAGLAILIVPFLRISLRYLLFGLTSAVCAAFGTPEAARQLGSVGTAMGYLAALTGMAGTVVFLCCVCFLKAGAA